jgi:hypothetical protein
VLLERRDQARAALAGELRVVRLGCLQRVAGLDPARI